MKLTLDSGNELYYETIGKGEKSVILIPGGPGLNSAYLRPLAEEISKRGFQSIIFEPGNYPNSSIPTLHSSINSLASELQEFIVKMNLGEYVIYGHSFGGLIVLEYLLSNPEDDSKVIISNSFSSGKALREAIRERCNDMSEEFQTNHKNFEVKGDWEGISELIFGEFLGKHLLRLPEMPASFLEGLNGYATGSLPYYYIGHNLLNISGALLWWDIDPRLKEIQNQALLLGAENDYMNEIQNLEWMNKLPNAETWISKTGSHFTMYDDAENYSKRIIDFIEE